MTFAAGWYGKIPSLGDFASRRLPPEFIAIWDSWLQHSMAASRAALGNRWLDIYLTSPMWRFALMPEAVDSSAWAGLLLPSVDKVGRHFPLTFAVELALDRHVEPATMILAADPWFSKLEQIALAALDVNFSADDLERELVQLPFPFDDDANGVDSRAIETLAEWWLRPSPVPHALQLPPDYSALDMLVITARRVFGASSAGKSIWWSMTGVPRTTEVSVFAGLPGEDYFAGLLLGIEWRDPAPAA